MESNALLEAYLGQLHLTNFIKYYRPFAADAARANQDHVRYLLALAEQEVQQREQRMHQRQIKAARFPLLRELADFDFSRVPGLNKAYILDLARGEYITRHEPIDRTGGRRPGRTRRGRRPRRGAPWGWV